MKKYFPVEGVKVINRLNGRTVAAIKSYARDLGIKSPRTWTKEEVEILKKYYPMYGRDTIRFLPKRSRDVIQQKACVLGISITDVFLNNGKTN